MWMKFTKGDSEALEKMFKESLNNDKLRIKVEALKSSALPGMILISEQARRIQEMSRWYGDLIWKDFTQRKKPLF